MTKKLEDLFDLADMDVEDEGEVEVTTEIEVSKEQIRELDTQLDKIDAALPTVRDISTSDAELDVLAELATTHFQELMELGMNVEARVSGEIFSTASSLLGHAISAKNAKIDKKLKIVQLQIQKARLDLQARKLLDNEDPIDGESTLLDRNSILDAILKGKKSV
jgi:hypothetical protein